MADKQATPDPVAAKGESTYRRSVAVGAFGRSFGSLIETTEKACGIKAVWRNETGPFTSTQTETVPT